MAVTLEGGEWSAARPTRTLSAGKTRYQLYRRLGGPQGRSGRAENLAHRDSILGPSSPWLVAIPTELPGPLVVVVIVVLVVIVPDNHMTITELT